MHARPRLRAHHRPLRRDADSVQLGLAADAGGVVLTGLLGGEIEVLARLDGSHTVRQLYAVAACSGVEPERVDALLGLLGTHGLLVPPGPDRVDLARVPSGARRALVRDVDLTGMPGGPLAAAGDPSGGRAVEERAVRHVLVGGIGPLPETVAASLRAAGIGHVSHGPWALDHADLGLRDPSNGGRFGTTPSPDLVILTATAALDPRQADPWLRHGIPHLPLIADGPQVVVGPLVTPGVGPCVRCLELHRCDRDSARPALLAQACPSVAVHTPVATETTLTSTAAGVVAMVVTGVLADVALPPGVVIELALPGPRLGYRRWVQHPRCPGHRATHRMAGPGRARVTMA
jgi:bacteriocin biosynthesis cyclodehydratase domain-containing protein